MLEMLVVDQDIDVQFSARLAIDALHAATETKAREANEWLTKQINK